MEGLRPISVQRVWERSGFAQTGLSCGCRLKCSKARRDAEAYVGEVEQYIQPHEADSPRLLLHTFSTSFPSFRSIELSHFVVCSLLPPSLVCAHPCVPPCNEQYHKQGIPPKSSHLDVAKMIYYKISLIAHMEFTTAHSKTIAVLQD